MQGSVSFKELALGLSWTLALLTDEVWCTSKGDTWDSFIFGARLGVAPLIGGENAWKLSALFHASFWSLRFG